MEPTTAYVPSFAHDVFASYAHLDDRPDQGVADGWITVLIKELRDNLAQRVGAARLVVVWYDEDKLDNIETVSGQLLAAVRNSAVLLVVLSPGYVQSRWCNREVTNFLDEIEARQRLNAPVAIVEMWPVERGMRPTSLQDRNPYKFWDYDRDAGTEIPLGWPIMENRNNEDFRKFKKHVARLAQDIFRKLQSLREQRDQQGASGSGASNAQIFAQEDSTITGQVFINVEPSNLVLARQIAVSLRQQGYTTFLPSAHVETAEARRILERNYVGCRAVVMVLSKDGQDWLIGQLRQLNKLAALRRHPLEFLWVVTPTSPDVPPWLNDFLNSLTLKTQIRIVSLDDL